MPAAAGLPAAQQPPRSQDWTGSVRYEFQTFAGDDPAWRDWHTFGIGLGRRLPGGSIALEGVRTLRFGEADQAVAVEAFADLWRRAFGNVRLQFAPHADVLPGWDARLELFQMFAPAWETAASFRRLEYDPRPVNVYGLGLGRYIRALFLRGRAELVQMGGESGANLTILARRFLASPDHFLELGAGAGTESVVLAAGPELDLRDARAFFGRYQQPLDPQLFLVLGGHYAVLADIPDRRGLWLTLAIRF
jgi:YaiO family outer membrane protein